MTHKKNEVLFIISKMYPFEFNTNVFDVINSEASTYLKFSYIIDPTRKELELLIQQNSYLCIIPCTQYTLKKSYGYKYKLNDYMVSYLLENLGVDFWGCAYIPALILHEKAICSQMSLGMPKPLFISKFHHKSINGILKNKKMNFPITLEPIYTNNYLSNQNYIVHSMSELYSMFHTLFANDCDIEEFCVQPQINTNKKIIITIIGNPPLCISFVCVKTSNIAQVKVLRNTDEYTSLISNSYCLFNEYCFRDFGQFIYTYDIENKIYHLTDINSDNCLNSIVISAFQQLYAIDKITDIINIILITFLSRQGHQTAVVELINNLSVNIPKSITDNIIPFSIKQKMNLLYTYETICTELQKRFLFPDERNRNEFITYISECIDRIPHTQNPNEIYLGSTNKEYSFLQNYEDLPNYPQNMQEVLEVSIQILNGQMRWHSPSMLYNINPPVMFNTVAATTVSKLYNPNAITSRTCAGFVEMEKQVVRQLSQLLGWNKEQSSGIFAPGGKYCLIYAVKCGLNRIKFQSQVQPVVITSEINHYSIESVCELLGLSKRCIRVPVTQNGTIDFNIFKQVLIKCFTQKIPIACIILSGGNTTHCNVENIKECHNILYTLMDQFKIDYIPYIYYDLVVCWPWLFFKYYDINKNKLNIPCNVLSRITVILDKILFAHLADGAGIDFHKGGFSPYSCSIFLSKNANELYSISEKNLNCKDNRIEPNRYSLGNSRGTSDILCAWNILQSVGIEGFQSYIANMLIVANVFTNTLPNYGFTVLMKNDTYGFATLIWASSPLENIAYHDFIKSDEKVITANKEYLYELSEYWIANQKRTCYTRFLPNYTTIPENIKIAVISLLPMTLNINEDNAKQIATYLGESKKEFDQKYVSGIRYATKKMPDIVEK